MESLDTNSFVPLYHQLKDIFLKKILNNEWKDLMIPSESELCKQYQISRITVRQALGALEKEGYIIKKQGKGSFASIPKIEQNLPDFYSFTDEFKKNGYSPISKVLEFSIKAVEKDIASKMKLGEDEKQVYFFKRLRYADHILMAIESTYLPASLFPNLKKEDLEKKSLYDIMRDNYGIIPISADQYFKAVMLNKDECQYFGIGKSIASMELERLASNGQRTIEYTLCKARGDMFRFHLNLR